MIGAPGIAVGVVRGVIWLWLAAESGGAAEAAKTSSPDAGVAEENAPNRSCIDGLRERHVEFVEWPTKGVRSPVKILGPLGAVRLRSHDPRSTSKTVLMDCELARALVDAAPAFRSLGVHELLYSGAYQYRTRRRSTRLSEHAHGLAIDVHALVIDRAEQRSAGKARLVRVPLDISSPVTPAESDNPRVEKPPSGAPDASVASTAAAEAPAETDGIVVEVTRDFEPGVGKWAVTDQDDCIGHPHTDAGRTLRTLACRLRASSIFREVITPDDNADHHDHFHLEAFPDALTRTRAVLARKPLVTDD